MIKPTLEQIDAYCIQRKNSVDAVRFFNYYESNGWKVGRAPMKNWEAAVRTWERIGMERVNRSVKVTACRACMDTGVIHATREVCSCLRGQEAKQARTVMAKVRALTQQARLG